MGMEFIAPSQQHSPRGTGKLSISCLPYTEAFARQQCSSKADMYSLTDTVDTHDCEGLCVPRVTVDMVFPIPGTLDVCAR